MHESSARWKESTTVFLPCDQFFLLHFPWTNWKKAQRQPNRNWDVKNKWRERMNGGGVGNKTQGKKVISTSKNAINISFDFLFASNHMITGAISIDPNGTRANIRATAQQKKNVIDNPSHFHRWAIISFALWLVAACRSSLHVVRVLSFRSILLKA